ncbi:MAG TPA: ABC transporter permease [Vicinamibacterales bacterium]
MPHPSPAERVYRLLLRCYPGEFRDEYEREMLEMFRERLGEDRRIGWRAVFILWRQVLVDAAFRAPGEHLDVLRQDVRHGIRSLRRAPIYALTAIATLALGVGANTAIFSVVHAVALRPLPYEDPGGLIRIWEDNRSLAVDGFAVSLPNFVSWRERSRTLDLAAWAEGAVTIRGIGDPVRVSSLTVTPEFFSILGTRAQSGRTFSTQDVAADAPGVALISEGLWKRQFGGDASVLGRAVSTDRGTATIVGVVPERSAPVQAEFFLSLRFDVAKEDRSNHIVQVMARIRPGVTVEQAESELAAIARQLESEFPDSNRGWGVTISTFRDWIVPEETRRALFIVLGAVCCVLLIACANVANLMLARAAGRAREVAVRMAIGAGRRRLVRQVLTEGLLLTAAGGAAGVFVAYWTMPLLRTWLPPDLAGAEQVDVNASVLLFSLLICAATGLMFAALPAAAASRSDVLGALRQEARSHTAGSQRTRLALAAAQIALATMLLAAAGLFGRSLLQLQGVPLGFDPSNVTSASIGLPDERYSGPGAAWGFYERLIGRLETAPGIEAAALTSSAPFDGGNTGQPIEAVGPSRLEGKSLQADWRMVSPSYFRALRIPLLRGDLFSGNRQADDRAIVLSEGMARRIWGDADPIGREIAVQPVGNFRVIGVVGDVRNLQLALDPNPTMYISTARYLWPAMTLVVRGRTDGIGTGSMIQTIVRDLDPELAVYDVRTTEERISNNAAQPRLNAVLVGAFALMACLLAGVGIYGVLAYLVSQRSQEIGIRMALGAPRAAVVRSVLGRGLWLTGIGVCAGIAGALGVSRWVRSLMFGVSPADPFILALAMAVVTSVALLASYLPARRASRVDPLVALRSE